MTLLLAAWRQEINVSQFESSEFARLISADAWGVSYCRRWPACSAAPSPVHIGLLDGCPVFFDSAWASRRAVLLAKGAVHNVG